MPESSRPVPAAGSAPSHGEAGIPETDPGDDAAVTPADTGADAADTAPTPTDTGPGMAAGRVLLTMVGALLLGALLNAETMLHRAETAHLGPARDVALAFWRPVASVSSATGLTLPRSGLDALGSDDGLYGQETAAGPGVPTVGSTRGHLGHEPLGGPTVDPTPATPAGPTVATAPAGEAARPGATVDTGPATATPLGLPGLPAPATGVGPMTDGPTTTPTTVAPTPSDPRPSAVGSSAGPRVGFPLRRPTVDDPLRVLVVGDSTMDALGSSLQRDLAATGVAVTELDVRVSTGLARPDYFDWPARLRELVASGGSEVVVIMVGANDAQPFVIGTSPESFGTERWSATYRARVSSLLDELTAGGRWVIWVSQPTMRDAGHDERMQTLNRIYADEVARHPTAAFIDTRPLTVDEDGRYAPYLAADSGDQVLVRQADGVHFTAAGGDRLAPAVIDAINTVAPLY
ncbi:MAG: DUF459 domain-containing protein [Acidimicrobiales bacterium]